MQCAKFEARLHELLDARQSPLDDSELGLHAGQCARCRAELAASEALFDGLAARMPPNVPNDFADRVLAGLAPRAAWRPYLWLAAPAALAAGLLIAVLMKQPADAVADRQAGNPIEQVGAPRAAHRPPGAIDEEYLAMVRSTGRAIAAYPEMVRWAAEVPEVATMTDTIRPVAHSVAAALDALWQSLPVKAAKGET